MLPSAASRADLVRAGFDLDGDALKTRPKGYEADHPRLELLRRKEIMAINRFGVPASLSKPAALQRIRSTWTTIRPLTDWVVTSIEAVEPRGRPG